MSKNEKPIHGEWYWVWGETMSPTPACFSKYTGWKRPPDTWGESYREISCWVLIPEAHEIEQQEQKIKDLETKILAQQVQNDEFAETLQHLHEVLQVGDQEAKETSVSKCGLRRYP